MEHFVLKEEHIKVLQRANIDTQDSYSCAPCIDSKRPYGNKNYLEDIAELIGVRPSNYDSEENPLSAKEEELMDSIHRELKVALKIILSQKTFEPGKYGRPNSWSKWERIS